MKPAIRFAKHSHRPAPAGTAIATDLVKLVGSAVWSFTTWCARETHRYAKAQHWLP